MIIPSVGVSVSLVRINEFNFSLNNLESLGNDFYCVQERDARASWGT